MNDISLSPLHLLENEGSGLIICNNLSRSSVGDVSSFQWKRGARSLLSAEA